MEVGGSLRLWVIQWGEHRSLTISPRLLSLWDWMVGFFRAIRFLFVFLTRPTGVDIDWVSCQSPRWSDADILDRSTPTRQEPETRIPRAIRITSSNL